MTAIKYGIYLPNFGPYGSARTLAELAQRAEQADWDGFFIWDHLTRSWLTEVADPFVSLSAAAMLTDHIHLGALITPLPRRRPWKVARETVTLDHLSKGRLIIGVGIGSSGGTDVEWGNFGEEMDLKKRAHMLDEGLQILCGLWSGQPFAFSGRHYTIKKSQFLPPPHQSPRIPIWVAGNWPNKAPFRRMARWDGMIPQTSPHIDDDIDQLKAAVDFTLSQRAGNAPFDVAYAVKPLGLGSAQEGKDQAAAYHAAGITWLLEQIYPEHFGSSWQEEWPLEKMTAYISRGPLAR